MRARLIVVVTPFVQQQPSQSGAARIAEWSRSSCGSAGAFGSIVGSGNVREVGGVAFCREIQIKDASLIRAWTGKVPGETFGFDATGMGDIDGDGTIDLLLTSAWSAVNGSRTGRMYIVSSR